MEPVTSTNSTKTICGSNPIQPVLRDFVAEPSAPACRAERWMVFFCFRNGSSVVFYVFLWFSNVSMVFYGSFSVSWFWDSFLCVFSMLHMSVLHGAGIFTNICLKNRPNLGKYTIPGACGYCINIINLKKNGGFIAGISLDCWFMLAKLVRITTMTTVHDTYKNYK